MFEYNFEATPKAYIRDVAPLVCLVLYINLEFDDEKHRVKQINDMFHDCHHDEYIMQLIKLVQTDKSANACYQDAIEAAQKGLIEKFDPDFDTDFSDEGSSTEKFYIVSFLKWAEDAGFKLPEYVISDLGHNKITAYYMYKNYRDTNRHDFQKIAEEEFEKRMSEPLWVMMDALLYILGYISDQSEDKKISFLRYKKRIEQIKKYALDAKKIGELRLYNYDDHLFDVDQTDVEEKRLQSFYSSSVKPKDFVKWVLAMPIDFPVLKTFGAAVEIQSQSEAGRSEATKDRNSIPLQENNLAKERTEAMEKLEKLLESLGYGFNPMPFTQKEIAKYLKSQPEFSYISEGSIVSHYIKPKKDWKFKKGSAPKDRPSLQSVISTK